jgi:hypothetical protein
VVRFPREEEKEVQRERTHSNVDAARFSSNRETRSVAMRKIQRHYERRR